MIKNINKIGFIVIILTVVMLNIFIGSNIKQPIWVVQSIVSIFTLCYIIVKKIAKEKNIVIKANIDIAVLLFMVATAIPFIAKTYVTLEGTCNFILKYWSVYAFYILIRNIVTDDKKIIILLNSIIISSIIPIIFGIDKLTFNIFEPVLQFINSVKIEDTRMISTFGYANTYAIYLTITSSIAIAQFLNTTQSKKRKALYIIYIIIATISIILTQSKAVLALITITIGVFIVKEIKNKKISKKCIFVGIGAIVLFFIYFFIAINISKPLEVTQKEKVCVIRGIEPNKEYKFAFDIQAKTDKTYNTFEIEIVEITRHFSEIYLKTIHFSNLNEIQTLKFSTSPNADHIEIRIKNQLQQKLTINELKINGKPYILEYKIIPDEIVRIFTTFNFKNSSVWQRTDYWTDALKIVKDHWVIGAGGNSWRTLYAQKQEYLYYAKEAHCYPLEVWMSFGILGISSYILILIFTIHNGIKLLKNSKGNKEKYTNLLAMTIAIILLVIHSFMDFDMSYLIIEMLFYMFIAIINMDSKKIERKYSFIDIAVIGIFIIISLCNILAFTADIIEDNTGVNSNKIAKWISRYQYNKIIYLENNNLDSTTKMNYIKNYIKNEPYSNQNTIYEIMVNQIIQNPNEQDISYLINTWKSVNIERKYEIKELQVRAEIMLKLAESLMQKQQTDDDKQLNEKAKEISTIIKEEYEKNVTIILNYERNREIKAICKFRYEYYTNTYEKALKLLEQQ